MKRSIGFLAMVLMGVGFVWAADDEARLLRFPAIHGDTIVFTYAGDLYTVSAEGGVARRLTSHDGYEMFPRFSPGRQADRLHRPVRRQHRGLSHPRRRRRAQAADLHRHARPRRRLRPHGPQQHRHGLERDGKRIVFRSRMRVVQRLHGPALHRLGSTAACRKQLPAAARRLLLVLARRMTSWPTTASSASSAPGSATAAAWPTTSGSTTSRQRQTENITNNPAQDIVPDVARRQDLLPLRPRRRTSG